MRILLVKPKAHLRTILGLQAFSLLEPLELGYLAAVVPPGNEVRVLDLRLNRSADRAFLKTLSEYRPDLVGLTGYTHESSTIKRLARIVREQLPRARVVVGGHHATVAPEDFEIPELDAVVRGEGCGPFREIVRAVSDESGLDGIPNVVVPGRGASPDGPPDWPPFPDPATFPIPNRHLWDPRRYRSAWTGEMVPAWYPIFPSVGMVRTSWGCRMRCSFCVVPLLCGGTHRPRPVDHVVEEIGGLPVDHVYFADDENFIDEEFAWNLAAALDRRNIRKRYFAWTRSTTVNRSPDLLRKWREVGLDAVFLGLEFASDEELKQAHKGGSVAANEKALDRLRGTGIAVHAGFMITPDYTESQFAGLLAYVRHLPPAECSFSICTPSPGTADYRSLRPRFWVANPFDYHDCMHPLVPTALPLRRFAALFAVLVAEGTARTPRRAQKRPARIPDLLRAWWADRLYYRSYRDLYRDFPRELWDRAG